MGLPIGKIAAMEIRIGYVSNIDKKDLMVLG